MQSVSITTTQKVRVTANPLDASGQPAQFNGIQWAVSDPNGIGITADPGSPSGQSVFVFAKALGTFLVTATGGPANAPYSTQFQVTVVAGAPTQFAFVFDPPVAQ